MAFMQDQVTDKRTWIEIDGSNGITFVDAADVHSNPSKLTAGDDVTDLIDWSVYYEGSEIYTAIVTVGYGARLSAPGYMDCTEWSVFDTAEQAEKYLKEFYGGDDEDSEDEDSDDTAECSGINCTESVDSESPYFATPCGTHCDECMREHVKECGICKAEFDEFDEEEDY